MKQCTHFIANKLKLNDDKSEALLCGLKQSKTKFQINSVCVGDAEIPFSESAQNLGVFNDIELSMETHISAVVKSAF